MHSQSALKFHAKNIFTIKKGLFHLFVINNFNTYKTTKCDDICQKRYKSTVFTLYANIKTWNSMSDEWYKRILISQNDELYYQGLYWLFQKNWHVYIKSHSESRTYLKGRSSHWYWTVVISYCLCVRGCSIRSSHSSNPEPYPWRYEL